MYTFNSKVRYSETDENGRLSIAAVVDYFQDCSTFHSESLGVGVSYLKDRGLLWVMSAWQIVIDRFPGLCENIEVGTYPYEFKGFMGLRNFFIKDETGNMILRANSVWSLMDLNAGRPARPDEHMMNAYCLEEKLLMDYAPRRISLPWDESEGQNGFTQNEPFVVGRQNLDSNHHVNNGQYIYMAQDYLPECFEIGQMRAEYKKSALLGDTIYPKVSCAADKAVVLLGDGIGEPYAIVEFTRRRDGGKV